MVDLGQKKVNSRLPFFICIHSNLNIRKFKILTKIYNYWAFNDI